MIKNDLEIVSMFGLGEVDSILTFSRKIKSFLSDSETILLRLREGAKVSTLGRQEERNFDLCLMTVNNEIKFLLFNIVFFGEAKLYQLGLGKG